MPQEQGVYRTGPLTLAVGEDLAQLPGAQSGTDAIAVLQGDRPVTLTVEPASGAKLTFQVQNGVDTTSVRFPACGGGVHRFPVGITFAGAGCARLRVQPGGLMLIPIDNSLSGCPDQLGHHNLASSAFPYLGVSCPVGVVISCDRVGIGVHLRQPAVLVMVRVAGRAVTLSPPQRPRSDLWLGYLSRAGLSHGPLAVQASGRRRDGKPLLNPHVVLTTFFADGTVATMAGVDQLHAGFDSRARRDPLAWVTAETIDRVFAVDLRTGQVVRRIHVAGRPEYVAVAPNGTAAVTSPGAGTVTVLRDDHPPVVLRGFKAPEIDEVASDGRHLFVTDGVTGRLSVISLTDPRGGIAVVSVGSGAHHIASSPDMRRLWIALGEDAQTIAVLDSTNLGAPRVTARFRPGFAAHDLAFNPSGTQVWVTSSSGPEVSVFEARTRRLLFRVPAGPPPQHITFAGAYAYITSGYGSTIEEVRAVDGHVLRHARTPYGSFELDAADGYVVTASLLDGRLAVYTPALRLLRGINLAPATRDVAIGP